MCIGVLHCMYVCMYTRKGTGTSDLFPPAKPHSLKVPQHSKQHLKDESVEVISDSSHYSYHNAKEWNPEVMFLVLGVLKTISEAHCLSTPSPPKSKLNPITLGNLAIIFPKTQETGYPRDRIEKNPEYRKMYNTSKPDKNNGHEEDGEWGRGGKGRKGRGMEVRKMGKEEIQCLEFV